MEIISRYWNGHTEDHPSIQGAKLSTFSTGVRNAYDAGAGLFIPYPANLVDSRSNAIPASRGWLYDSLSYQGFAPQFADGFSSFVNRNTFDHDSYRVNLANGQEGTRPELPETLDFEYRKRPIDAAHVEGIVQPVGDTFIVRYSNAFGPGIHREIFFGWQRFADEIVIEANTGIDQEFRFAISTTGFDWFSGKGPNRRRWDRTTTNEFQGGFELQHLGTGKLSFIRPDAVTLGDGSRVPVTIRLVGNLAGARGLVKLLPAAVQAQAVYPIRIGTVSSFFSGAGDGRVRRVSDTTFFDARNTAIGTEVYISVSSVNVETNRASLPLSRCFFSFDTSFLSDNAITSGAMLKLYGTGSNGPIDFPDLVFVGPTTQVSSINLELADYNKCGSLDNPTEIAARKAMSSTAIGSYNSIALTNLTVISKTGFTRLGVRTSLDVNNVEPTGNNVIEFSTSGAAGTSQDPIIEVTYTVPTFIVADLTGGTQQMTGGMDG